MDDKKSSKRKRESGSSSSRKSSSRSDSTRRKRRRWDTVSSDPKKSSVTPESSSSGVNAMVQQAMEKAKQAAALNRQIMERVQNLGLPGPQPFKAPPTAGKMSLNPVIAHAQLQAQRAAQEALAMRQAKQSRRLILNKDGKLVDETGQEINLDSRNTATLKANIAARSGEMATIAELAKAVVPVAPKRPKTSGPTLDARYLDPGLKAAPTERVSKSFAFVKPGTYLKRGQSLRMKQLSSALKARLRTALAIGDEKELGLAARARKPIQEPQPIPDVEWWDKDLLLHGKYGDKLDFSKIHGREHHPMPMTPLTEARPPPPMPLVLTKQERKKLKRQRKMEDQREKTDLIRFGLIPAPEPKMTLKNLMKVLEQDAIANPSAMEAKVRKQMAERKAKHEAMNESNKLTPEQRRAKKRAKLMEDTSVQTHVALFRAGNLNHKQTRFKVDMNAQQYNLTGCAIVMDDVNLVVVEGGPKGIKKFKRLMLHRIKWPEPEPDEPGRPTSDDEDEVRKKKQKPCALVWEGIVVERNFKNFRFEVPLSEELGREYLTLRRVGHYWDMVVNFKDDQ